jgi:ABC-type glutathione transport system ATPase component
MLVIEHDMPLITSVSDEIVALELGRVVLRGTPERVMTDPRVVESYLGGDLDVIHRSGTSKSAGQAAPVRPKRRRRPER